MSQQDARGAEPTGDARGDSTEQSDQAAAQYTATGPIAPEALQNDATLRRWREAQATRLVCDVARGAAQTQQDKTKMQAASQARINEQSAWAKEHRTTVNLYGAWAVILLAAVGVILIVGVCVLAFARQQHLLHANGRHHLILVSKCVGGFATMASAAGVAVWGRWRRGRAARAESASREASE